MVKKVSLFAYKLLTITSLFFLFVLKLPVYEKFREAVDLIKSGGAISIVNYFELEKNLTGLLNDSDKLRERGKISSNYVEKNRGATDTILRMVKINI